MLSGEVTSREPTDKPIVVVAVQADGKPRALDLFRLATSGPYRLIAPAKRVVVIAFEDSNGNLRYDPGEPCGGYRDYAPQEPKRTNDSDQRQLRNANIVLSASGVPPAKYAGLRAPQGEQRDLHAGTVSRLDRPRFGAEAGDVGVWQPIDFVFTYGAGIFFLQPYDPNQIPVLFVHGLGGFAQEFTTMIDELPEGFQPWVVSYPSGWDLEEVSHYLTHMLEEVRLSTGATTVCIVAHSMGGALARHALGNMHRDRSIDATWVRSFITIASPLMGHPATEGGVKYAPQVVPAWRSLLPGGELIRSLYKYPLAPQTSYTLLFTIKDQTVPLESQLRVEAQKEARHQQGIHAGHVDVLKHPLTLEAVYTELRRVAAETQIAQRAGGGQVLPLEKRSESEVGL